MTLQTTYRLNSQEISLAFLDSLKNLFAKQDIEITVKSINDLDQTTILSQNALSEEWDSPEDQRWDILL